jgi:hypothetical protein
VVGQYPAHPGAPVLAGHGPLIAVPPQKRGHLRLQRRLAGSKSPASRSAAHSFVKASLSSAISRPSAVTHWKIDVVFSGCGPPWDSSHAHASASRPSRKRRLTVVPVGLIGASKHAVGVDLVTTPGKAAQQSQRKFWCRQLSYLLSGYWPRHAHRHDAKANDPIQLPGHRLGMGLTSVNASRKLSVTAAKLRPRDGRGAAPFRSRIA